MKKLFLMTILSLASFSLSAGEGDENLSIGVGYQYKNTVSAIISYEFENRYHNAWEVYIDLANAYTTAPDGKVYSNTFWDYKSIGIGGAWKPALRTWKNSVLRWRFGADIGANVNNFQASAELGLEYTYYFKNNVKLFVAQKNDFVFWTRDHFRTGIVAGIKIPLN